MRFKLNAELLEDRANPSTLNGMEDPVEPYFPPEPPPAEDSPVDPWDFPEGEIPPFDPEEYFPLPPDDNEGPVGPVAPPTEPPVEPYFPPETPPSEDDPIDPWDFPEGEIPPFDPELPFEPVGPTPVPPPMAPPVPTPGPDDVGPYVPTTTPTPPPIDLFGGGPYVG